MILRSNPFASRSSSEPGNRRSRRLAIGLVIGTIFVCALYIDPSATSSSDTAVLRASSSSLPSSSKKQRPEEEVYLPKIKGVTVNTMEKKERVEANTATGKDKDMISNNELQSLDVTSTGEGDTNEGKLGTTTATENVQPLAPSIRIARNPMSACLKVTSSNRNHMRLPVLHPIPA